MREMPEGTRAIVQDGLDEAAQSLFSAADVPLAKAEELRAAVTSPAVRAVLEMRIEQMVKFGHSLEGDLDLPIGWLPMEARQDLQIAADCINAKEPDRNLVRARARIVRAAAMCLAAIDVLDATIAGERGR